MSTLRKVIAENFTNESKETQQMLFKHITTGNYSGSIMEEPEDEKYIGLKHFK